MFIDFLSFIYFLIKYLINLRQNRYSVIIISQTLKTLNLNKLKKIENGIVYLHTSKLCLFDTIDWKSILDIEKSFIISDKNREYLQTNQCGKDYSFFLTKLHIILSNNYDFS